MADLTPTDFAVSIIKALDVPDTPANRKAIVGWQNAEGGHWHNSARYNPLNTTQPEPGAGNTGSQGNIKVYKSWQQGVKATVDTLRNGRYGGILSALKRGNDPAAVANAIGASPWGTNGSLVRQTIGSAKAGSYTGGATYSAPAGTATTTTTTTPGVDNSAARKSLLLNYLQNDHDPSALLALGQGLAGAQDVPGKTVTERTHNTSSPGTPPSGKRSPLLELFWQGQGGIDVKNGARIPVGSVSGHTDHVHVAAGPKTVVALGKLAQSLGLHVGENPHFGGVTPVHVNGSYHYKGEAIDVSGDPKVMREYAHKIAREYGIKS